MHFYFLGTSAGVPTKQRNVTALGLGYHQSWYLIDCGEGTQHQLLRSSLSLRALQAIFITHVHGDHCYGLPGLLASATMSGRKEALQLIVPAALKQWLEQTLALTQMRMSYELCIYTIEDVLREQSDHGEDALIFPDCQVAIIPLSHRVPSYAYRFTERPQLAKRAQLNQAKLLHEGIAAGPVWGQLQRGEAVVLSDGRRLQAVDYQLPARDRQPQAVIIGGDNDNPALLAPYMQQVQLVVHEATYTQAVSDQVGPGPQHCSAKQVAEFAQQQALPNLILTHFSARYSEDTSLLAAEAAQYYQGRLFLAQDFDHYVLNAQGECQLVAP